MVALNSMRKLVLIVEDDRPLAQALEDKLSRNGYMVLSAENGEDGLQTALREKPDIILLDLLMPKMNGIAFMGALRKDVWGKSVPIVVLTNLSADSRELVSDVVKYKPAYYLVKSDWGLEEIVEKLNAIVLGEEKGKTSR